MPHSFYKIVPKKVAAKAWTLFNEASGEFCGDRLRKGQSDKLVWPFKLGTNWTHYTTLEAAQKAANALQEYLEAYESGKGNQKSKTNKKLIFD